MKIEGNKQHQVSEKHIHKQKVRSFLAPLHDGVSTFSQCVRYVWKTPETCNNTLQVVVSTVSEIARRTNLGNVSATSETFKVASSLFGVLGIIRLGKAVNAFLNNEYKEQWGKSWGFSRFYVVAAIVNTIAMALYTCYWLREMNFSFLATTSSMVGSFPIFRNVAAIGLWKLSNVFFALGMISDVVATVGELRKKSAKELTSQSSVIHILSYAASVVLETSVVSMLCLQVGSVPVLCALSCVAAGCGFISYWYES